MYNVTDKFDAFMKLTLDLGMKTYTIRDQTKTMKTKELIY